MKRTTAAIMLLTHIMASPLLGQTQMEEAFPNLSFLRPVDLQAAGDGSNRLFVVEQRGVISVFENNVAVSQKRTFLDIQDRVNDAGNEEGLLGLAFHPDYADSGYFYVNYTAASPRRTVIARYSVSTTDPDSALHDSEFVVLEFSQPFGNHNGGQIAFGADGFLYIASGDGGSGGDPLGHGQNLQTLLGALLRIDVDTTTVTQNYGIPEDNPFVGNVQGYREEIYAYGLRNPWRFSFDPPTGRLWLADVGQNDYEEIDIIDIGGNYGWNIMEGFHCYDPPAGCNMNGLELPLWEYDHTLGSSVTGGYVYRGVRLPSLVGAYVYADFASGRIWSLQYDGVNPPINSELIDTTLNISSLGVDDNNELYFCAFNGKIYQFEATASGVHDERDDSPPRLRLYQNHPNPFNPGTTISFVLIDEEWIKLSVFDPTGRLVAILADGVFPAGRHQVTWDGNDRQGRRVRTGVYFYRIVGAEQSLTRKMVLLK